MPRGVPVQPELRARVVELARSGMGRNDIAREAGTSVATVTRIAKAEGIAFDREQTRVAVAARKIDLAAERAQVSALFLQRAREALEEMAGPYTVFAFGGKENDYNEHLMDRPPSADKKNLMATAHLGLRGHLDREKFDSGDQAGAAKGLLGDLAEAFAAAADALPPEGPADRDEP